jgi:uncharacterized membrane protein YcfT
MVCSKVFIVGQHDICHACAMGNHNGAVRTERMGWMDLLRGAAILLVAFNHGVLFSTLNSNDTASWLIVLNDFIGPVRMPLMVLLSGMLLTRSVNKGWHRFIDGKLRSVLYPYAVWSVIVIALDSGLRVAQKDNNFLSPLDVLIQPVAHLWFLYYLFIFFVVGFVLARVPSLLIVSFGLLATLVLPGEFQRFFVLFSFFFLGRWLTEQATVVIPIMTRPSTGWVTGSIALPLLAYFAVTGTAIRYQALSVPLVVIAVGFFIWLSIRIEHFPLTRALKYIGQKSVVFYLVQWFPVLIGVEFSMWIAPHSGWVSVAIATAAGLFAGYAAAWITDRIPITNYLFHLPSRSRSKRRTRLRVDRSTPRRDGL